MSKLDPQQMPGVCSKVKKPEGGEQRNLRLDVQGLRSHGYPKNWVSQEWGSMYNCMFSRASWTMQSCYLLPLLHQCPTMPADCHSAAIIHQNTITAPPLQGYKWTPKSVDAVGCYSHT